MHELPVTKSILDTVLDFAKTNEVRKVVRIHLVVGQLNEFRGEWIQRYFDYLSSGTPAEGAEIAVLEVPAVFRCRGCGREFTVEMRELDQVCCTGCSRGDLSLVGGREFLIRDMEVE